jgi:hypothetical protein
MAGDQHVHEVLLLNKLGEGVRGEVDPAVRDQELELARQQGAECGDDRVGGDLGAGGEQRQAQALAGTVVGQDQDRDPRGLGGGRRQRCLPVLLVRQPLGLLLLAAREDDLRCSRSSSQRSSAAR